MNLKKKRVIKILGAGIAGITSAIILAKNGYSVKVFESRSRIGSFFERTVHSLRNYLYDYDVVERYKKLGIKIQNVYPIFKEFRYSPALNCVEIYSKNKPLFYNFIRGYRDKRSIDIKLYQTAKNFGVNFYFNKKSISVKKVDIVATGASSVNITGYGRYYSKVFGLKPNSLYFFLDNDISPKGYICILPFRNNVAILIVSRKKVSKKIFQKNFEKLRRKNPIIKNIIKRAKFANEIFGVAFSNLTKTAIKNGKIHIGESAGFLDSATGFGTHYAILSGYLAAKSIIKNESFDKLWKNEFKKELKNQYFKKKKLQKFNNNDYENTIKELIKKFGSKVSAKNYARLHKSS